jgi:hypothetical protein
LNRVLPGDRLVCLFVCLFLQTKTTTYDAVANRRCCCVPMRIHCTLYKCSSDEYPSGLHEGTVCRGDTG